MGANSSCGGGADERRWSDDRAVDRKSVALIVPGSSSTRNWIRGPVFRLSRNPASPLAVRVVSSG